jgi:hypothetical protein
LLEIAVATPLQSGAWIIMRHCVALLLVGRMQDTYPPNIEIEIDRAALTRYLRLWWLAAWLWLAPLGGLFAFSTIGAALNDGLPSGVHPLWLALKVVGTGAGIGGLTGLTIYVLFCHRLAARQAAALQVSVEGAYLRIRQNVFLRTDRKLHFRAIVDYTTVQGCLLRRCNLHALRMMTTAGGQSPFVTLHGIKDCLKVRDMLADIDRMRE